jgi:hypothetical protein
MFGRKANPTTTPQKSSKEDDKTTSVTDDGEDDNGRMTSLFHRLFAPGSIETDVSEDSQYDSLDSHSQYTDMSGSADEDGRSGKSEGPDDSTVDGSDTSTLIKFDRDLRARHRAACKSMTVSDDSNLAGRQCFRCDRQKAYQLFLNFRTESMLRP